ncbi:PepSY-associated TM helix domain-containing protein [Corynebacterium aquilae]|uniref:PepSY-associated TM helix domain-containing protein n=1 Tax=Corynebacterium aquilae TaxID=203263 RepID=UPI0009521302|nr:PepSY domain-containing protein [Corynebacterium aquilae]
MTLSTSTAREESSSKSSGSVASRKRASIRPILARLHFYAGIFAAPFIIVASLTGLGYAIAPTVETMSNQHLLTVSAPSDPAASDVPVSQQVAAAQSTVGELPLAGIMLGKDAESSTRVLFADESLPKGTKRAVFVNPHTGEVLGTTTSYGGSGALPFRQWLSIGHKNLWLGEPGRFYSEAAAAWMGFLAVGGAVLWFGVQRAPGRLASMFRLREGEQSSRSTGRKALMRAHSALGMWAIAGMLFLTITGLTWSGVAGENIATIRKDMGWSTPKPEATLPANTPSSYTGIHADTAAFARDIDAVALTAQDKLTLPITLIPPKDETSTWIAQETRAPYRAGYDAVTISGVDGQATSRLDFADFPFMAKLTYWLIQAHMGLLFGLPNQLLLVALALAIIAVAIKGYQMWFSRARRSAPEVKDLRALLSVPGIILVTALVAYGVLAPLFGITLLVMVAIDLLWKYLFRGKRRIQASSPDEASAELSQDKAAVPSS